MRSINGLLLAMLVISGILAWKIRKDPARPNFEIMPDMTYSVPYDSFALNPAFPDGKTLRRPVAHTIPQGFTPLPYEATEQDAIRAGEELTNPLSADDPDAPDQEAIARGGRVYGTFCRPCHGPTGAGDGTVVQKGYPAPPALTSQETMALPDGRVFHIITHGQGNMPPHAAQIAEEDRWKAMLHIRSLQAKAETAP